MLINKKLAAAFFIMICSVTANAQSVDSAVIKRDTTLHEWSGNPMPVQKGSFLKSIITPALMIGYGLMTLKSDPLQDIGEELQRKIWIDHPHREWHADNYLQFAPAVAVYGLNIAGVKGKNNFRDRSIIYFMSNVFMGITVSAGKQLTHEQRPDKSDYLSFPSGHTAEAFASAEFLRQEYKDVSPWYGIAGYVTATATGLLRMYNNKHWLNDIIAGAGVGIISTKLAYWVYPSISKKLFHKHETHTTLMPYYQHREAGLSMLYVFH